MTSLRAAAAIAASLALAAPAAAGPLSPGQLDLTFSGDGTLRSQFRLSDEVAAQQVLPLRGGRLAVLTSPAGVVRLRAGGRLDSTFARRGVARLTTGDSAVRMAEAPDGGLVVAGTRRADALAVRRLRRDGRRDRSFGTGGLALFGTGTFLGDIDVEVAPDGTALVAMVSEGPNRFLNPGRLLVFALDPAGRLVPGFGAGDGIAELQLGRTTFGAAGLVRLPDGRLRYATNAYDAVTKRYSVLLAGLTADGLPDTAVGPAGVRAVSTPLAPNMSGMALDAAGRLLITTTRGGGRIVVEALTADGARDPAYGDDGFARVRLPFGVSPGGIAVLGDGRTAVSVTRLRRPRRPAVVLLKRGGRLDRGFGRRGVAIADGGFPRRRAAYLDQLAVDHLDRLVLGGLSGDGLSGIREDFGSDYLALARMRVRRPALTLAARAAVSRSGEMRLPVRCRAATTCQAALSARRGRARGRVSVRVRAGATRVVRIPLGAAGARLAARGLGIRVSATIVGGRRIEPVALRVRLRRA